MSEGKIRPGHRAWGRFRTGAIGQLMSAPPEEGELGAAIGKLAEKEWVHPLTGERTRFGASTIERWYYGARAADDPVSVLSRKIRKDQGTHPSLSAGLGEKLRKQHKEHPNWTYKLHADNLAVIAESSPELGTAPSYSSVRRYMKATGLVRRRLPKKRTAGAEEAATRLEQREVRSYESEYVNALWHYDFHEGSRKVLMPSGEWRPPQLFGALDDRSRLACHLQWYLTEDAENAVHGLSQAFQKRGLPRIILSDNGKAMTASETVGGLRDLGIEPDTTLPYSPYQNGKQESFWGQVEGRLLPMLEGVQDLTLEQLNEATQAWVELEYNRMVHSETHQTPMARYLAGPSVGREAPSSGRLRELFTRKVTRVQRRSDGTVSLSGVHFEVPSRFRHLRVLHVRFAKWNLRHVYLVDPTSDLVLAAMYPLDKAANADGLRRTFENAPPAEPRPETGMAPLLRKYMAEYAATGLPPAYVPQARQNDGKETES